MRTLLLPFASLLILSCHGQYNGPESVEYDPIGDRYFVSNTGSSVIKQRAQDGTVTNFAIGLSDAPYGIELQGDTLFAAMGGSVQGFLTSDGSQVFNLDLGGSFLNGITSDGHFIYTTDFSGTKIFKVDVAANTFTTLVANTSGTPNGIVYDPVLDKLWVAFWGSGAKIKSYDKNTGAQLSTFTTGVGNIDGITLDCQGRILISSWSPARLSRYENTFTQSVENLVTTGLSSPADIDYDAVHNLVCIPNGGNLNSVVLFALPGCDPTGVATVSDRKEFSVYPDPADGQVRIDLALAAPAAFEIMDTNGAVVMRGTMTTNGIVDVHQLAPGAYVMTVPSVKRIARFVRR